MLPIFIGFVIGAGLPLQTAINARLRRVMGSPFTASLISFSISTVFLALITFGIFHTPLNWIQLSQLPLWLWLGGIFGVVFLTGNILLFPKIGGVQTVIMPVLGQILMGLLIDQFGWFTTKVTPLSLSRLTGALLVIAGVLVTVALPSWIAMRDETKIRSETTGVWLWRGFGILTGMLSASQTAVNGHLGQVLHSPLDAALISFLVGTATLLLLNLILRPRITFGQTKSSHSWWMWLGGFFGAFFVLGNAYLAPIIGTGLTVVIVLAGQMTGSLIIDGFGLLDAHKTAITKLQILGILMMVLGIVAIRLW